MPLRKLRILVPVILLLLGACNSYQKVLNSKDINYKLTKANEYYDNKKYTEAEAIYEQLIPVFKGTKSYESLFMRYAMAAYHKKDYLTASYRLKTFTDMFPQSAEAEEFAYLHAYSLYQESPKPSLEQTNTYKAMEALQNFINAYPASKHIADANRYIDEARAKLEAKDAGAALLYYNIGQHRAATVAYKSLLRNYPESSNADYYQYMIVRSLYLYANRSIAEKQEERYGNTVSAYREMADLYPHSSHLAEAEKYSRLADQSIQNLRKEKS